MTLAEEHARFVSQMDWACLPEEVRRVALELFADWLANAAAGLDSPLGRAFLSLSKACEAHGRSMLIGALKPADPLWAALVNAGSAHALEFDDSYRAGLYHPGAPIISAGFSAACHAEARGPALLTALVAGYEVSLRLASAVNPGHYRLWHTTGTVGSFGAAAAAAYALKLDPKQTASAFGIAGTQAGGLWEVLPNAPLTKNLHPAKAAHSGLLAALLSQNGIEGPTTILEGPRGFFAATVPEPVDSTKCTAGLGEDWLMLHTTLKAYPVCGHAMTPIEASLDLHGQFAPSDVEEVEVRAHPVSLQVAGQRFPADEYQAKFSIPYCVAVALLMGRVGQEEFSPRVRESPAIREFLHRIRLVPDDGLVKVPGQRPARVTVRLSGGETLAAAADVRKGDPELSMTADEKRDKFLRLVGQAWGNHVAEGVFNSVRGLPGAQSILKWAEELRVLVKQ